MLSGQQLEVFTTRPDTIFGATYMVIAPEHPLLEGLTASAQAPAVQEYVQRAALKSDLERTELQKVKTGVFTGVHPWQLFEEPVCIRAAWLWDGKSVLPSLPSAACMQAASRSTLLQKRPCPSGWRITCWAAMVAEPSWLCQHMMRGIMSLPVSTACQWCASCRAPSRRRSCLSQVRTSTRIHPFWPDLASWHSCANPCACSLLAGRGTAVSSSSQDSRLSLDGQSSQEAAASVVRWLEQEGRGSAQINYKLRDWLFARQRYWGEPFPIVFPEGSEV